MATFQANNKAPGVYIQEITLPGPIPGISTSIAAFLGPAAQGPTFTPTLITDIQQFWNAFGGYMEDPYRVYVTHAVNGFFAEGGQQCYFVRVGTGKQAWLDLLDAKNRKVLVATALKEGVWPNTNVTIAVAAASLASTVAAGKGVTVTLDQAKDKQRTATTKDAGDKSKFQPGDVVLLIDKTNPAKSERAIISSISSDNTTPPGTTTFTFVGNLGSDYSGGTMRVADLLPGQNRIRVQKTDSIEPGSYVHIEQSGGAKEDGVVKAVDTINNFITLTKGLQNTYTLTGANDVAIATREFSVTVNAKGLPQENFLNLSLDPRHSRYFDKIFSSASISLTLADPPTTSTPPDNMPVAVTSGALQGGVDEDITKLNTTFYHQGIDTLLKVDDVNLLCVPDAVAISSGAGDPHIFTPADTQDIQSNMVAHCQNKQDRFAILDPLPMPNPPTPDPYSTIKNQRQNLNSDAGYGALYFPWISISNPVASGRMLVPPSGHVAGVYANSDNNFGVYRAPANESVVSALAVETVVTDEEQGPLNEQGINVIRSFKGQGIKIWGARTIAPHDITAWRFINVRRLLIFIEKSIQEGTRFAVFEPNNLTLWQTLKRLVTAFLRDLWEEGALFGDTPDLAFRVRVDETLNPPEIRSLGQLIIQVTVVPTTPAEFIVFQVIQDITGASLQEGTK